jgi:nucleotide-binding universal stress UspA family protein
MFAKVIVGYDGSKQGRDALCLGEALTARDGELIVCCVNHYQALSARIDPTEPRVDQATAQELVAEATGLLTRGLTVTPLFVAGAGTPETLQRTAREQHTDLLVLGSSHRGAVGRVLIGSVTEQTLHGAPCAVAVAPVGFHTRGTIPRFQSVAVGYDVREPTPTALLAGVGLCEKTGAALQLVAVADDAAIPDPTRATMPYAEVVEARIQAAEQAVALALNSVPKGVSATGEVRDGEAAGQLLEVTESVDLLVLGSHGRGLLSRLIMGSTSDVVVRSAACPVLIVPSCSASEDRAQPDSDTLANV